MSGTKFSQRILNIGFLGALVLAAIAFLAAGAYLLKFAGSTQEVVTQMMSAGQTGSIDRGNIELLQNGLTIHAYLARVLLVSCGMFVALAFGFLGFALFLVGATGQSDAAASGQGYQVTLTNLAPGSIAIIGAVVLAGICVTRYMPVEFSFSGGSSSSRAEGARELINSGVTDDHVPNVPPTDDPLGDAMSRPDPNLPE